jgi:hypothetical protein
MDGTIPFTDSFVSLAYCKNRSEIESVYIHGFAWRSRSGCELDEASDFPPRGRMPKVDFPKFHGKKSKTVETRCEYNFKMYLRVCVG